MEQNFCRITETIECVNWELLGPSLFFLYILVLVTEIAYYTVSLHKRAISYYLGQTVLILKVLQLYPPSQLIKLGLFLTLKWVKFSFSLLFIVLKNCQIFNYFVLFLFVLMLLILNKLYSFYVTKRMPTTLCWQSLYLDFALILVGNHEAITSNVNKKDVILLYKNQSS